MTSVADSLADGCDTAAGQGNRSFRRPCGTLVSFGTQLNNAHPEGWRDRPCEAPATYRAFISVNPAARRVTWCQVRPAVTATAGKDGEGSPRRVNTATSHPRRPSAGFGYATGLSCRECDHSYPLGPYYACEEC